MSNAAKKQVVNEEAAQMTVVKNDEEPIQTTVIEQEPELTLEQKINKVEDLSMLIDKWHKLIDSRRNLQTFKLSTDGMSNNLKLIDTTSGHEFKTYNSAVISRVLDVIRQTLDERISEVEAQIKF
jgi:hypothetical protein